jgi:predicted RNase H-like nuclease (RuvC/YqgF family)
MFALVSPFLAQATSSIVPPGLVIPASVLAAVATLYYVVSIWNLTRQKPPAYDVYATKKDLDTTAQRWREEIQALDRRREDDQKESRELIGDKCNELERVLSDKISDNKQTNSNQFGQLHGELGAVRGTMQTLSNEVMRTMGKLEGKLDGPTGRKGSH